MMQIVKCDTCGNSDIAFGDVSVNVELTKATTCSECDQTKRETTQYFFCSQKCFERYIKKVYLNEAVFNFNRNFGGQ